MPSCLPLSLTLVVLLATSAARSNEPSGFSLPLAEIVRLDTSRVADDRRGIGVGFFVAPDRIATCWHVLRLWDQVRVTLHDGREFEPLGVIAVSADLDLAILQLAGPVGGAGGLELAAPPVDQKPKVWAIGHPQGESFTVRAGAVGREIRTGQLAARPQAFVRKAISKTLDHRWLQHSAEISDGDSGGPLLDARGRVLGVNTWVDDTTGAAYALHSAHLAELLEQKPTSPRSLGEVRAALAEKQ